jgi:hypothetical protein
MPYQGAFRPTQPEKYLGNTQNIVYRSSWEKRFFMYCDTHPGILKWASEEFSIPYISPLDSKLHRYFPDVWLEAQTAEGRKGYLIEIKPKNQAQLRQPTRKTKKFLREAMTVAVNHAKWDAAKLFCKERDWTFVVLTEDELFTGAFRRGQR